MAFTESKNSPGLLVLIDLKRLLTPFLGNSFIRFQIFFSFGKNTICWVKILNTNIKVSILQCVYLSELFGVQRS